MSISRPDSSEFAPWALKYVDVVERRLSLYKLDSVVQLLQNQLAALRNLLKDASPDLAGYSYAPGKWSLIESLVHITDTERVFAYRLLSVARGVTTPLPGMDQDAWAAESRCSARSISDALDEMESVRAATLTLVRSLDDTALMRIGNASNHPFSARAFVWLIAGHMEHHIDITRDQYMTRPK